LEILFTLIYYDRTSFTSNRLPGGDESRLHVGWRVEPAGSIPCQRQWTQKGTLDVTQWQEWFLSCLDRAIKASQGVLTGVLNKARFWQRVAQQPMNARQTLVLNRLLDGFEGKLTTSKWATLAQSSQDTAYRDILDLVARGILRKDPGGGRSTSYSLVTPF
jgi:Fic family protein